MLRDIAVKYAWTLLHKPYKWGGDDPLTGFDCSGGVQEVLWAVGKLPKKDHTANDLMKYFGSNVVDHYNEIPKGSLVFFGIPARATHVGFAIGGGLMFEFGGGGSKTITLQDAIAQNAYSRIRPINKRNDFICALDPFQER